MEFDRKSAMISFLKEHKGQKFTPYEIAKWLVENYLEEARHKANASTNQRIIAANSQEEKDKEIIGIYAGEISSSKRFAEQRQEPNIE